MQHHRHHLSLHTPVFRRLVYFNLFYVALSLFNAGLSITFNLKAQFGEFRTEFQVWLDYLIGIGTAISPPLVFSILQLALTDVSFKHSKGGNLSVAVLFWINLLSCVAAVLQPMSIQRSWSAVYTVLHLLMIFCPAIMAWLCFDVFINRSRENNL